MIAHATRLAELYQDGGITGAKNGIIRWWRFNVGIFYKIRLWLIQRFSGPVVYRTVHGAELRLDTRKEGVHREFAVYGTREKHSLEHYESRLSELDGEYEWISVLDIGANIGHFALLADTVLEAGQVIAAEPDPRNTEELGRNIQRNNRRIRTERVACGEDPGETELHLHRRSNWSSIEAFDADIIETVTVPVTTVDELIEWYQIAESEMVVLRMDTEGFETQILRGASELFASDRPIFLFVELHPKKLAGDATMGELVDILTDAGFEVDCFRDGKGYDPEPIEADWNDLRNWREHPRLCKNGTHLFAIRR